MFEASIAAPRVWRNALRRTSVSAQRLLLLENDSAILDGFTNALEDAGFLVLAARDVTMGRCLVWGAPDIAIIDICACGAAGFARKLWRSGVPVVTLGCEAPSGHASMHLRKPLTVWELREAIYAVDPGAHEPDYSAMAEMPMNKI